MGLGQGERTGPVELNDSVAGHMNASQMVDAVSRILSNSVYGGFSEMARNMENMPRQQPIDIASYFTENTATEPLKDDDMITVSIKTADGYVAKFAKLSDLKKYITA